MKRKIWFNIQDRIYLVKRKNRKKNNKKPFDNRNPARTIFAILPYSFPTRPFGEGED
jgi:hypothetical protein